MQVEDRFMARCLELARHGAGRTAPNPMVGAVVVHNGEIVGEGYHRQCGEAHAEVNAIASVKDETLLRWSTLYVSLEPCAHHGKTPPCVDLIIRKRIPRVVVGCLDPFPEVSGRGVERLREAGIQVITGVMEKEARELNEAFMTFQTKERPFVTLKWAESADGFIDYKRMENGQPRLFISNPITRMRSHKLRAESAAILVGTHTALWDNPSLTTRYWAGASPVRMAIDLDLKIPKSFHLLDGSTPTLIFTTCCEGRIGNTESVWLDLGKSVVEQIMQVLRHRKLNSLIVEGGANMLQQFIDAGCWDRAVVEKSTQEIGMGVRAPILLNGTAKIEQFGGHAFIEYRRGSEYLT